MNVLMLGWELPPDISGGLGVACEGILEGLAQIGEVSVTFLFPVFRGNGYEDTALRLVAIPSSDQCRRRPLKSGAVELEHELSQDDIGLDSGFSQDQKEKRQAAVSLLDQYRLRNFDTSRGIQSKRVDSYATETDEHVRHFTRKVCEHQGLSAAFDVIHAHDWMTYEAALYLQRVSGKKLIVHVHSLESDRVGLDAAQSKISHIERRGLLAADRIIAVSQYTKQCIVDAYDIEPSRVSVVHNAIRRPRKDARHDSNARSKNLIAYIGRVTDQKGPERFVAMSYNLWRFNSELRFVMAGRGDRLCLMQSLVKSLGMGDAFSFPGFLEREEVQELLSRITLLVMPSVSEPFGLVALEAVDAGVPVIVSKHSGMAEVVDMVVQVDPEDIQSMASAVKAILRDPNAALGRAQLARCQAYRATWLHAARKINSIYLNICADINNELE